MWSRGKWRERSGVARWKREGGSGGKLAGKETGKRDWGKSRGDSLNDLWCNDLARSAPGGEAIDDHHPRLLERLLVLSHAVSNTYVSGVSPSIQLYVEHQVQLRTERQRDRGVDKASEQ